MLRGDVDGRRVMYGSFVLTLTLSLTLTLTKSVSYLGELLCVTAFGPVLTYVLVRGMTGRHRRAVPRISSPDPDANPEPDPDPNPNPNPNPSPNPNPRQAQASGAEGSQRRGTAR